VAKAGPCSPSRLLLDAARSRMTDNSARLARYYGRLRSHRARSAAATLATALLIGVRCAGCRRRSVGWQLRIRLFAEATLVLRDPCASHEPNQRRPTCCRGRCVHRPRGHLRKRWTSTTESGTSSRRSLTICEDHRRPDISFVVSTRLDGKPKAYSEAALRDFLSRAFGATSRS